jgi:hypothetical protein
MVRNNDFAIPDPHRPAAARPPWSGSSRSGASNAAPVAFPSVYVVRVGIHQEGAEDVIPAATAGLKS